jgi:hypothetical protein
MADKKEVKKPVFRLSLGRTNGRKFTFTKVNYGTLNEAMSKAKAALGTPNVKEAIITVK